MANQMIETVPFSGREAALPSVRESATGSTNGGPKALYIPVGTNLANVERWMIFATLRQCSGNKTRAAALLGVSLKTLYNRLNAYRAQGLAMDYDFSHEESAELDSLDEEASADSGGIGELTRGAL